MKDQTPYRSGGRLKRPVAVLCLAFIAAVLFAGFWNGPVRAGGPSHAPDSRAKRMRDLLKTLPHVPAFNSREQSALANLGQKLFFDDTLSTPKGQSCSSCHAPEAGFRFPISRINRKFGVANGAIPSRFGFRAVPPVAYAAFIPDGPPSAHFRSERLFIGGMFWNGRALDLPHQATFPFQDPNEMNNLVHGVGSPELVVLRLKHGPNADMFREVFGADVFEQATDVIFADLTQAIAAYERSPKVSPFTSRFDLYLIGRVELTPEELDGFRLYTGTWDGKAQGLPYTKNAQCATCHGIPDDPVEGPFLFTNFCYANIGVPRNQDNPFYDQTDPRTNPHGYNPLGRDFIDYGLGDFLYPMNGLPVGNVGEGSNGAGDFLQINGAFKAPTLRNVDKRPRHSFVKPYMHNGVFKSLKEVIHFYNARNLTTVPGEVIDFTQEDPYANLQGRPLFDKPEISDGQSVANPSGDSGEDGGQVGNLGLTDEEEDHMVAFLQTLSDGYFEPELPVIDSQPTSASVMLGGSISFSVKATGAPFPSFQWYRGEKPVEDIVYTSGARTPTLTIDRVSRGDLADNYYCVITNTAGSVTTEQVSLTARLQTAQPRR